MNRAVAAHRGYSPESSNRPVTPEVAGSSPVAPAFVIPLLFAVTVEPFGRFEVTDERRAGLDGHDQTVVLPDLVEKTCDQFPPFSGQGLGLPGAREVGRAVRHLYL